MPSIDAAASGPPLRNVARRLADGVGGALFLLLFGVFLVQITARFVFNRPLPWTDEAAVILYVWVILWAAALMVPAREQVVFDLVWNAAGRRTRMVMRIAGNALLGGLALVALPANWDYVCFMARESTPVLGLPFMAVFMPFVLLLASLVLRCCWAIWQTLQGRGLDDDAITLGKTA